MNKKNRKLLEKMNKDNRRSSLEKIKRKKRREVFYIVTKTSRLYSQPNNSNSSATLKPKRI